MFLQLLSDYFLHLLPVLILFVVIRFIVSLLRLRSIPGPWPAKVSDLWRLQLVYGRRPQEVHLELHRQYGDLVRLGPNCVSVTGPDTVQAVYGIGKGFVKVHYGEMVCLRSVLISV